MPADLLCWIPDGSNNNNGSSGNGNSSSSNRTNGNSSGKSSSGNHGSSNRTNGISDEAQDEDSVLCEGESYSIFQIDHLCATGFSGGYNCSPYDDELYPAPPNTPLHCLCGIAAHAYDLANATIAPYQGSYTLAAELPNHYLRLLYPSGVTPETDFTLYGNGSLCACGVGSSRGPFSGDLVVAAIPMDKPWSPKFVLALMDRSGLRKELAPSYAYMRLHGGYSRELVVAAPLALDYVALGKFMAVGGTGGSVITFAHNAWSSPSVYGETAGHIHAISSSTSSLSDASPSASMPPTPRLHINLELDLELSPTPTDMLRSATEANLFRKAHSLTLITHTVSQEGLAGLYGLDLAELNLGVADLKREFPCLEIRLGIRLVAGFTDQNGEFAALVEFVNDFGVPYVRFVNDKGNPYRVYSMMADYHHQRQRQTPVGSLGGGMSDDELDDFAQRSSTLGVRNMLQMLRKKCKGVHLGSYNIPSGLFDGRTYPYLKKTKFKKPRP